MLLCPKARGGGVYIMTNSEYITWLFTDCISEPSTCWCTNLLPCWFSLGDQSWTNSCLSCCVYLLPTFEFDVLCINYEHALLINIYRQECRLCGRIATSSLPRISRKLTRKQSRRMTKNMTSTSSQSAIYALTLPIVTALSNYNYSDTKTLTPDCIN